MGKIATWSEIAISVYGRVKEEDTWVNGKLIVGLDYAPSSKLNNCPPKTEVLDYRHTGGLGSPVYSWKGTSSYANNRLVETSMVGKYTPPVSYYTLTLNISNMYSAVALFTASGTPNNTSSSYTQLMSSGPNVYTLNFTPGAGIDVNIPTSPGSRTTIYSGQLYRVWGQTAWGGSWTLIATLTHVDGDKTEYI